MYFPRWQKLPVDASGAAVLVLLLAFLSPRLAPAECIPFTEANQHIGATRCITGKVLRVEEGDKGVTYLDFCQDYRTCPFTVVVFPSDLRDVGDVRQLRGRTVEVRGEVKQYDGRAEIILNRAKQLSGEGAMPPPLPKNYDVERKGHYSAGKFSHPKAPRRTHKKKQSAPISIEDPSYAAASPE